MARAEGHPAFGFKCDLIRLIASLVYRNPANQDLVREWVKCCSGRVCQVMWVVCFLIQCLGWSLLAGYLVKSMQHNFSCKNWCKKVVLVFVLSSEACLVN